jgi:hypothetical protein
MIWFFGRWTRDSTPSAGDFTQEVLEIAVRVRHESRVENLDAGVAWRDWGRPPAAITNCFATAVLRSADGAYLLGAMGAHTANAGQIYFPCGTPEPGDVVNGRVDMEHNARHELKDETGLDFDDLKPEPDWISLRLGTWAMAAKIVTAPQPAEELRERILQHLASQPQPELADIHIVRGPADLDRRIPLFVSVFLRHIWG